MKVIKAPEAQLLNAQPTIFLAGSIEMGTAERWQNRVAKELEDCPGIILDPRRDDWDSSWSQDPDTNPFREQVEWEQDGLSAAELTLFYFSPGTQSPIALMELGLRLGAGSNAVIVCCPKGFWRHGNVVITCRMHGIEVHESLEAALEMVRTFIGEF